MGWLLSLYVLAVESRRWHATMETRLLRAALPIALPLQGQARGRPARGGARPGRTSSNQHPRLPDRHRLQWDQEEAHPEAHHAGLLRVPAAGRGPGRHAGLDQGHQGEQQDRQRGGVFIHTYSHGMYTNTHTYWPLLSPPLSLGDRFLRTSSHQQEAERLQETQVSSGGQVRIRPPLSLILCVRRVSIAQGWRPVRGNNWEQIPWTKNKTTPIVFLFIYLRSSFHFYKELKDIVTEICINVLFTPLRITAYLMFFCLGLSPWVQSDRQ